MRKYLIVHAHPEKKSFNAALKNCAFDTLSQLGNKVKVSDLYLQDFNPIGGKEDFIQLEKEDFFKYQMEQVHAFQHNLFAKDVQEELDKLIWCDVLIFNFPLWWFGLPAILKGWVDRIFAMGAVYGAGKGVYDNGFFKGKQAFLCFTTGGPEMAYGETGKNGELDTILFPIQHGMLYFTGFTVLEPFISFSPARADHQHREAELERYKAFLSDLDSSKVIY